MHQKSAVFADFFLIVFLIYTPFSNAQINLHEKGYFTDDISYLLHTHYKNEMKSYYNRDDAVKKIDLSKL